MSASRAAALRAASACILALAVVASSLLPATARGDDWPEGWYPEPEAPAEPRLQRAGGYKDLAQLRVPFWWDTAEPVTVLSVALIRWYQTRLSPHRKATCPMVPSCSRYGLGAIAKHGWLQGWWMTLDRLLLRENPGMFEHYPHIDVGGFPRVYDPVAFGALGAELPWPLVPPDRDAAAAAAGAVEPAP